MNELFLHIYIYSALKDSLEKFSDYPIAMREGEIISSIGVIYTFRRTPCITHLRKSACTRGRQEETEASNRRVRNYGVSPSLCRTHGVSWWATRGRDSSVCVRTMARGR